MREILDCQNFYNLISHTGFGFQIYYFLFKDFHLYKPIGNYVKI
jgi:hypothetical protein